jgi:DNA-directed RNA polymerase sigma subunit (sigma70/sigma32)
MLFVSVEDFFEKAALTVRLTREEEKKLAIKMKQGDAEARGAIINSYLPMAAAYVKRAPKAVQTLNTVYLLVQSLEKGVDVYNFEHEGDTFAHHLSWRFRQCITRCIADRN